MTTISASAPGKLMLFGEHAVVYDRPCLVTAVGLRIHVSVEKTKTQNIEIQPSTAEDIYTFAARDALRKKQTYPKSISSVMAAIARLFTSYQIFSGLHITTRGPQNSYGLGSSSAVTVATIRALSEAFDLKLSKSEIFNLSYKAVLDIQGKASGFDVAAAVYGGTLYFVTGGKRIEPLDIPSLPIIIGYSGSKVSTINYINNVYQLYQRLPRAVETVFDLIQQIVDEAKSKMLSGDWETVGDLMNINQGLLDGLGVNTLPLARIIYGARGAGALGAKLSGAGGGDCMFALANENSRLEIEKAMKDAGAQIINLELSTEGVRLQ